MKKIFSELYRNFLGSLDNKQLTGFSAKKMTAFAIVICIIAAHIKWITLGDFSQLEMVLTIDFSFIAVLFGINEYGKKMPPKEDLDAENKGQ